ncbi:transcriptional regulator [Mesorhizobium sp. L-8-10]|uniref:TetR/AcrR family transcriptional regulator C-terminal domain-containing protein n=1 Tax=Mesorhizobium sp. L-8-10 TaxID=2744523 RepID=UPI0019294A07|nr:TetR/AcrR family transcriptional regulator C-terminal domain-containing protein [Mesorhizobium sp. L-8-10]BCH35775.1 transcriptional regulator [Mesorhizobium sp. L-8-10]
MKLKVVTSDGKTGARTGGPSTRHLLREAAIELFMAKGYDGVSVAEIARSADAFPNQVTHHFGSKEALFVEAASRAVLRSAKQAELRTRDSKSNEDHTRKLISYLLGPGSPAVMMFAEAMLMARRKADLQEIIRETVAELHVAGEAAMVDTLMRTGWRVRTTPDIITRGFWSAIFGLALEKAALGERFEYSTAEAVALMMINLKGNFSDPRG